MRLYVSTYEKYNNGNLAGKWVDLDDFSSEEEFLEYCAKLHSDEEEPEFMFPDYEGLPYSLYSECGNLDEIFEYKNFLETTSLPEEAVSEGIDNGIPLENIEEAYFGENMSDEELGEYLIHDLGFEEVPERLAFYFDYGKYGRDAKMDFIETENYLFYANF